MSADCTHSVPKGVVLIPDVSCVVSFSSEVVRSKYEFARSLSVSARVSGGVTLGAFSVGAELNMDTSFKASAANFQKKASLE
nr:hypothetical protein BaRGS_031472 [Batillaria attramentaria]